MALESFEGQPSVPSLSHARRASQLRLRQDLFKRLEAIVAVTCLLLVSVLNVPMSTTYAQCTGVCGDLDSNGLITSADLLALFPYISSADSTGLDLRCANVDDHTGIILRDFVFLAWDAYLSWSLDCEINSGPFVPLPNAGYRLLHNSVYPAGDTSVTLYVDATFSNSTQAVALVLRVLVNGEIPSFGDVAPDTSYLSSWDLFAFNGSGTGNIPAGDLMGVFISFDFVQAGPGRHPLGRAEVIMPAAAQARVITLEQVEVPLGSNETMAVEGNVGHTDTWALYTDPWIIDVTGDFNNDRVLTSSDIIGLVNFVFKSGKAPYPFAAAGDVNCSGSVSSSDIIRLVNYIFKSGSSPCDVASECTLTLNSWTCP